jgi:ammonium transporter, Amt family
MLGYFYCSIVSYYFFLMNKKMLGTFILWFGWYSFNGASALLVELTDNTANIAALAATNSSIAAGSACLFGLFCNMWILSRENPGDAYLDLQFAMNGCLGGLVSITAGCAVVEPWAALVIGGVGGIILVLSNRILLKWRIDDAVDAIPVHFVCGIWGVISVGLFTSPTLQLNAYLRNEHPGLIYSWWNGGNDFTLLGAQVVGLSFIVGWVVGIMLPFFLWLDYMRWLRSDPLDELIGLDVHEHGALDERELNDHEEADIGSEHLEAYRRRRQFKNSEVLMRRSTLHTNDCSKTPNMNESAKSEGESMSLSPSSTGDSC